MKFFECPYCNEKAATLFDLGNSFYLFSQNKQCDKCNKNIKLNLDAFFESFALSCFIGFVYAIGLLFFLIWIASKLYNEPNVFVLCFIWAILVIPINYLVPYMMGEYFNKRLFDQKP